MSSDRYISRQISWNMFIYVVLGGLDSTVLKRLQEIGAQRMVDTENPISFCNVLFVSNLIVGVMTLLQSTSAERAEIFHLRRWDRVLLVLDAFAGLVIGPLSYFLALEHLSVISQSLLFSLELPMSCLLAYYLLRERFPERFWGGLGLILLGLVLSSLMDDKSTDYMDDPMGLGFAAVSILCFASSALCSRLIAARGLAPVTTLGIPSMVSALVFGVIAVAQFGLRHFHLLSLWWVFEVIVVYGITLSLGIELTFRRLNRLLPVALISLYGSLSLVVAMISAALILGEQVTGFTVAATVLILAGVTVIKLGETRQEQPGL